MIYEIMIKGGLVMYPLLFCSILSLAIILERLFFWINASRNKAPDMVDRILSLAEQRSFEEASGIAGSSKDYLAKILLCGLVHREFSLSAALEMASGDAVKMMKKYLGILDTIITLAPLLGIFGTVTGIIHSFEFLSASVIPDPKTVTSGIAQALITTAAGLGVAILTLIPYNYFISKIEDAERLIEKYATSLEIVFNKHKQEEEGDSPQPRE